MESRWGRRRSTMYRSHAAKDQSIFVLNLQEMGEKRNKRLRPCASPVRNGEDYASFLGNEKKKVAPLSTSPVAQTRPPWRSITRRTMARPTPVPSNSVW